MILGRYHTSVQVSPTGDISPSARLPAPAPTLIPISAQQPRVQRQEPLIKRPRDSIILDLENTQFPSLPSFHPAPDGSHQALAWRGRCSVPAFMQVMRLEHGGSRMKSRTGVQLCVVDAQSRAQLSSIPTPTPRLSSTWPTMVGHTSMDGQGGCTSFAHLSPADTAGRQAVLAPPIITRRFPRSRMPLLSSSIPSPYLVCFSEFFYPWPSR